MTAAEIATADRPACTDRLELLSEHLSDPALQRVTHDRYSAEAALLAERIARIDDAHYCASCENVEVEAEGDRCDACEHDRDADREDDELDRAQAAEAREY